MKNGQWRKTLLVLAGWLSVALGGVGILIPVLPTTPFLLLAAGCFMRSSPRLYHWLTNNRLFGDYIETYRRYRAIPRLTKALAILLLWLLISASVVFIVEALWLRIGLLLVALVVTSHLLSLRTLDPNLHREKSRPETAE